MGDGETKMRTDGEISHHTDDAGRLDDQGRLWLLGRVAAGQEGRYPFDLETAARSIAEPAAVRAELEARLPNLEIALLPAIPMDKRHNSKADCPRLKAMLEKG